MRRSMEQTERLIHCLRNGYYLVTSDFTMRTSTNDMLFVYVHAVKHAGKDCALFVPLFYADHPTLDAADRAKRDLQFYEILQEAEAWNQKPIDERQRLIEESEAAQRALRAYKGVDIAQLEEGERERVVALRRKLLPMRFRYDPATWMATPIDHPALRRSNK